MCKNAEKTIGAIMQAIEPDVETLETIEGITGTPNGIAAINAYKAAETAALNWVPGTTSQVVIEGIGAFNSVFATLPLPDSAKLVESAITGAIALVIGIIKGNSPAPAIASLPATTPVEGATADEHVLALQKIHESTTMTETAQQVETITGQKISHIDMMRVMVGDTGLPARRYKEHMRAAALASGPKYAPLAA